VPVQRVYRRVTRCGFGQQQLNAFTQQPNAFINQSGPFINQQFGGAFPQGFDPGAFRAEESEERFDDEQRAGQADEEDNDPANQSRMMVFDASGRPFNSRPEGMWCRVVRVPSRAVYRKTISCGR
jgi:hypothetical protein